MVDTAQNTLRRVNLPEPLREIRLDPSRLLVRAVLADNRADVARDQQDVAGFDDGQHPVQVGVGPDQHSRSG